MEDQRTHHPEVLREHQFFREPFLLLEGEAEDAAVIYTFMGCCKLTDVDVRKWLGYFLNHIHDYDTDYSRDLSELFPHNLKKARIL